MANGTYVHALSARDDAPDDDAPFDPATGAPPAATTTTSTTSTTTVPSSHLSFHGASPVAALDFLPADAARNLPPVLLAVQEDGAVAAWCWVPAANDEEEAAGKNGGGGGDTAVRRRKMRWAPMAAPAYAGGPPRSSPRAGTRRRATRRARRQGVAYEPERAGSNPTERNRNGNGNDDDLWGGCVVSLACLLGGGPRGAAPTLVVRRLRLGRRNVSGGKGVHRAEKEKEEEKEEALETLARYPGAVDVLTAGGRDFYVATETSEAEAEASEARGGEGKGSGSAGKRVVLYRWRSDARVATARVDLGRFAAAADEAARRAEVFRAEDGFSDDARNPFEDGSKNGTRSSAADAARDPPRVGVVARLAAAVHFPSREVAALTERGCVLRVGPALEASPFSLGGEGGAGGKGSASRATGPGFDPDASSSPGSPGSRRPGRLSARLVGTLDGFAAAFGSNSARRFGAFGSLVALGPFLHLAWFHDRGAASRRSRRGAAGAASTTSSGDATSADKKPPTSFSSDTLIDASDDARDWDVARWEPAAPPGKSAATSFHVRLGATLGTTPLPSLAPLRDEEEFGFGGDDTAGFDDAGHTRGGRLDDDPAARYGSSRARAGPSVRLLDFGAAGHFLVAKDAGRAPAVFRAATRVPAAMASAARAVLRAAEEVKERLDEMKGDHSSEGGGDDGIADVFSESGVASRARHAVAAIRATLRECAAFGGALERLEAALRLAAEELETALAARGVEGVFFDSESGGDVSGGGADDRGDWDRAATAALLLLDRPPPGTRAEATWMKAAAAEATRREASVKSFDAFADEPKNHRSFDRAPGGSSGAGAGSAASIALLRAASAGAGGRLGADASDASPYASDASDAAAAAPGGTGCLRFGRGGGSEPRALGAAPGAEPASPTPRRSRSSSRRGRGGCSRSSSARSDRRRVVLGGGERTGDDDPARAPRRSNDFTPRRFSRRRERRRVASARSGAASDPSGEALDVAAGLLARAVADAEEEEARRARESESRERREKTTTKKTLATRPFEAACAALRVAWPRGVPELTLRVAALAQKDREEEEAERAEEEEAGNRSSSSSSSAAAVRRFRRSRRVVRGGPGPAARVTRRFSSRLRHFARRALSALVPRHRSAESAESLAALGATLAMAGREHAAAWLLLRAAASDDDDERDSDASDARTPSGGDFEPNRTDLRTTTTRDDDDARDAMDAMIALTVEDDDPGGGARRRAKTPKTTTRRRRRWRMSRTTRRAARRATSRGPPRGRRARRAEGSNSRRGFSARRLGAGTRAGTAAPRGRSRRSPPDFSTRRRDARARARRKSRFPRRRKKRRRRRKKRRQRKPTTRRMRRMRMRMRRALRCVFPSLRRLGISSRRRTRWRRRRVVAREGTCSSARRVFSRTILRRRRRTPRTPSP